MRVRVLITGGGSAGHVLPSFPVIERLTAAGHSVVYVGSHGGPEAELVADRRIEFHAITTGKLRRYFSLENLTDAFRVLLGIWQAFWLVGKQRPDVVFSKGGFVAFPVVFAAWLRRVPVVAHESDYSPGLANRLSLPFLEVLALGFKDTSVERDGLRCVHTGSPMRPELLDGDAEAGRVRLGFADARPIVLVTGGSLGAERLNRVVRDALDGLTGFANVVHVCGPGRTEGEDTPHYRQFEYVSDGWGDLLAAADVVVSRAGANTLFELLSLAKLNLLVPLPAAASRGDQLENAAYAEREGYSVVITEDQLTSEGLPRAVQTLLANADEYHARLASFERPDAAAKIEQLLLAFQR